MTTLALCYVCLSFGALLGWCFRAMMENAR
jgi:hypothetical protein